jgi:virginiamycin B lyase
MESIGRRALLGALGAGALAAAFPLRAAAPAGTMQSWPLATPRSTGIHDVAPAPHGGVWYTAQRRGHLGGLDPKTGRSELIARGMNSKPHGVIPGPDGAAWITDSGQGAIVRVGWPDREVRVFALPEGPYANLNTAAFDGEGRLWFTGQAGIVGRLEPRTGRMLVKDAPRGRGPYGICATPSGDVWYCSLAGSYIAQLDLKSGESRVVEPPTKNQGARRVWSDSAGRIWVSEWNSGNVSVHDPKEGTWRTLRLPGLNPRCYAVWVDDRDGVWLSEWADNATFRFDSAAERFERFGMPRSGANVRQIHGRRGEVWLPESGTEHLTVIRS